MKIKILFVGDINSTHLQKWIKAFYKEFDLAVFSLDKLHDDTTLDKDILDSIYLVTTDKERTATKAKFTYLFNLGQLKKAYNEFKPDIVHAHYASSYGFLAARIKPKRLFVSVWGSDVFEFPKRSALHKSFFKHVMKKADEVFSTSYVMKKEILKYCSREVNVIPFGVDTEKFRKITSSEAAKKETITFGTVKTLRKIYGIDRLIRAFALFQKDNPDAECHIYGKGPEENELRNLAKELGVENNVRFRGVVKNEQVPAALHSIDIFCVLSRAESFGVAAVEASACQLPVIASKVGGLPEVVEDEKTGYLVDGEDIELIASKMSLLAADDKLREQLGENGRTLVLNKYDWEKNVETMRSFYLS